MENELKAIFTEQFGVAPTGSYFAPGRINLIGEHTDYNGGHVFPASIKLVHTVKRENEKIKKFDYILLTSQKKGLLNLN